MKALQKLIFSAMLICLMSACKKDNNRPDEQSGDVTIRVETASGITYKVYVNENLGSYKGILVMGSGNDPGNPSPGSLDGGLENNTCKKAAENGYVAAVVQYRATPGNADWNGSATMVGQDYATCINALSAKYGVDKSKSVVGGVSYSSAMLLTNIVLSEALKHTKGLLASCWTADAWRAQNFKIPVFNIVCNCNCDGGGLTGAALMAQINPAVKAQSEAVVDNSCNTHCGGNWVDPLYTKMTAWLN
ncbi:hypothetical protein FAZ19_00775 [Sphingobacterium alkalisoli]|uniref:Alpha/beta hydrolase n=1 Tax=Sphingobacterium alkalisoli TaxID=1874115 RepID=A0A4U0H7Q5_9SPHI|nr:hypothetical protein [Sphingobacterium alkalisoli]TJY67830.1 hypothetical protein FAZ19_00775 [Sphingobacterium alkalisoli]